VNDSLVRLDHVRRELALAEDLSDVKRLRDQAAAVQTYAKAQRLGLEVRTQASEIVLLAERRAGGMLAEMGEKRGSPKRGTVPLLKKLGIEPMESKRWQAVAAVPAPRFERYLAERRATKDVPTRGELLRIIRREANTARHIESASPTATVDTLAKLSGRTFGTVYADPPWPYENQGTRGATDNHYPTMSVDAIAALPVASLAADDAHLHLWTTNAFLFEARRILDAWGFEYKSCFVWVKPQMGTGNYWRVSHEFLLLGVRGGISFADQTLMSWGQFKRGRHSAKPEAVRRLIERASPGPRLELFGRRMVDGWTVWGNEIRRAIYDPEFSEVAL
jgi:N6-adenosine-specific RNA methylase IME4